MTWIFDAKVTPLFCLKRIINDIGIPVFPHVCWYNHVKSNFVLNPHPRATLQPPRRGHPLPSRADDEKQRQRHRNIIASPSIWRQPRQPLPHQVPQQQGQLHSTVEAIGVRRKSRFKWNQHGINKFVEGKIYENLQETMELPMNNIYIYIWRFSVRVPLSRFIESFFLQTVPQNSWWMNVLDVGILSPAIPLVDGCIHMGASTLASHSQVHWRQKYQHDSLYFITFWIKHWNIIRPDIHHHTSLFLVHVLRLGLRQPPPCLITKHSASTQLLQAELQPAGRGQLGPRMWTKHSHGKSPLLMGKLTISMAMFNSYVKSPEGV